MKVKDPIELITREVKEQASNEPQIIHLRPIKKNLSWQPEDDEYCTYLIGLGDDDNVYISTPEKASITEDGMLLTDIPRLLEMFGASKREIKAFLEAILEALKKHYKN